MQLPTPAPSRSRIAAVLALLALAAVVAAGLLADQRTPPAAEPAGAAYFDTEAAWAHLERIAGEEPTPIGSPGGAEVRDYLVEYLESLGLATEVQEAVGSRGFGDSIQAARVDNVVATLPGTDPTGRVYLAAHYDTTPTTPGTSDDKHAVAAILEAARALTEREPPRNDVVFLLTDGEEPGLLGAEAFAEHHPYAADGGVVINLEGAGNSGPAKIYNSSPGGAALIAEWAASAPHPAGESGMAALWAEFPANSDFTALNEAGFLGMEFSPVDGRAYYHHPRDTVDNFAPETLHHQGANALELAAALAERDLAELGAGGDATYFTVFGTVLRYPGWLVWPLAIAAATAALALAASARRGREATVPRLLGGAGAGLLAVAASVAAAVGLWELLVLLRPGYGALEWGDPYRPEAYRWAVAALCAAITWGAVLLTRRRLGEEVLAVGALALPALFGVAMAALIPPLAYTGTLAALAGAAGMLAARSAGEHRPVRRAAALAAGALPGVLLLVVNGYAITAVMGLGLGAGVGALYYALAALLAAPLVIAALPAGARPRTFVPAACAMLAAALAAAGLAVDTFDEEHPETVHLFYVLDADSGEALWASASSQPHDWAAEYVPDERAAEPLPLPVLNRPLPRWAGEAQALDLAAPELEVLGTREADGAVILELALRSPRGADLLSLHLDRPVEGGRLSVPGRPATSLSTMEASAADAGQWPYEVEVHNPPEGGVEVALRVAGTELPELGVADYSFGLDGVPGHSERPAGVAMAPSGGGIPTDSVVVATRHEW